MRTLPPDVRATVRARLLDWSRKTRVGRVIASNLDPLERFLPPESMAKLLCAIASGSGCDFSRIAAAYERAGFKENRRGGPVRLCHLPPLLGRAVERDRFTNYLFKDTGYWVRFEDVEKFVDRLILGSPLEGGEAAVLMSAYSAWASWDPEAPAPFAFGGSSAEKIRSCMGLDPESRCPEGLLLLVYERPAKTALLRPTVADAGLFLFFEPPPPRFDAHGLTRPWLPGVCKVKDFEPYPRPEAIHDPLEMEYLHLPVRLLF